MARRSIGIPKGKLRWTIANLRIDVNTSDNPSNVSYPLGYRRRAIGTPLKKKLYLLNLDRRPGYIGRDL